VSRRIEPTKGTLMKMRGEVLFRLLTINRAGDAQGRQCFRIDVGLFDL
jgi:hypothetical protein